MRLRDAKFCVDCEWIFEEGVKLQGTAVCPSCGSPVWVPLQRWLQQAGLIPEIKKAPRPEAGSPEVNLQVKTGKQNRLEA